MKPATPSDLKVVAEGAEITTGTDLIRFDRDAIEAEVYPLVTPVIVTNSDDFNQFDLLKEGLCQSGDAIFEIDAQ